MQNKIVELLLLQKDEILDLMGKQLNISATDPLKDTKFENIALIFNIYIDSLTKNECDLNTSLKAIASKIAKEKASIDLHLNKFIKKMNVIRDELFIFIEDHLGSSSEIKQSKEIILKAHDALLDYTVSEYIKIMVNLGIQEKEQLSEAHKERLIMLGQMTSTFVHEIRNPLTSIKGFVQLLKAEYPDLKYLDIVTDEIKQLNDRLTLFLTFSKKKQQENLQPTRYALKDLIQEIETFLYPSLVFKNIEVITDIDETICITVHREEFRQVLLNILLNALDALEHSTDPKIMIEGKVMSTETIEIKIANNGPKISDELISDIFKPFTTTKKAGTGIGLFVCNQIIEKNNGTLFCSSTVDWTTFVITLPKT
ncbi:MAG: sensor histidine kinase [Bacillus sp. (in: firmicutes)]